MPDPSRTDVATALGDAWCGAVLLHPHPSYGGDRHNVVIEALWRALPAAGAAAVRFDLGGDDLAAGAVETVEALDLLPPDVPLAVVGYSFGALVACGVDDPRVAAWALVAPPLREPACAIGGDDRPKLVLAPAHDAFCPPDAAREATAGWSSVEVEEIPSADHFLSGSTGRVAERVVRWLRSTTGS